MRRWMGLGLVAAIASSSALAETRVRVVQEADRTVVRKKTVVDFTDVAVEGDLTRPEGSYVLQRTRSQFRSMVKIRDNFAPELQKLKSYASINFEN